MTALQIELDAAYKALAAVPVAGDYVEVMAEARERLRRAYRLAGEVESDGGQDDR